MGLLSGIQFGLLAAQPAFGLGDLHALPGPEPDEVGLEFGDYGQHVEQQSSDGIGRVVDGTAEAEPDTPGGQFIGDRPGVGERAGESVEFGDDQGVAVAAGGQRFA